MLKPLKLILCYFSHDWQNNFKYSGGAFYGDTRKCSRCDKEEKLRFDLLDGDVWVDVNDIKEW